MFLLLFRNEVFNLLINSMVKKIPLKWLSKWKIWTITEELKTLLNLQLKQEKKTNNYKKAVNIHFWMRSEYFFNGFIFFSKLLKWQHCSFVSIGNIQKNLFFTRKFSRREVWWTLNAGNNWWKWYRYTIYWSIYWYVNFCLTSTVPTTTKWKYSIVTKRNI